MFIDRAEVKIKAGKGGNGAVSFRREKYEPEGGPNGGDGGRGGSVIVRVDQNMHTLMDFRYQRKFRAEDGEDGKIKNCFGRSGQDLIIRLPQGTVIYEKKSGKILADLSQKEAEYVIARGGRGGKGNWHFKSSTRQAPDFAQPGTPGQEFDVILELKSIADVGLVGFPNVGKSSLLARITKARPKVADYHFTTLYPNLGVVEAIAGKSFILADIPGIIEGASKGVGLGLDFLRHVERTRLILHVVDVSGIEGRDPIEDYEIIEHEIEAFSDRLAEREKVVFLNKTDLVYDKEVLARATDYFTSRNIACFLTSTVTGEGIQEGMVYITHKLDTIEEIPMFEEKDWYEEEGADQTLIIEKIEGEFLVSGAPIDRLLRSTNFQSYSSRIRFQATLGRMGVYDRLREQGITDGDTVRVGNFTFDYLD